MWTFLLIGLIIGGLIGYTATRVKLSKQINQTEEINTAIREENNRAQAELEAARKQQKDLNSSLSELSAKILKSQEEADIAIQNYYDKNLKAAKQNFALDIEQLEADYTKAEFECKKEYLKTLDEASKDFIKEINNKKETIESLKTILAELQEKVNAAIEANKRAVELEQQKDFYRLVLSDIDIEEIKRLREVTTYLRNSEPLNKVIWKIYYERPYTDLVGRVIGSGVHCGIYKITNIENGMCYVGQAVNIADRWKQHIKRGIGADPPTRNKLYPAMLASGVENFTFEIVEECDREKLNDREQYWQEYFGAKEFGYSIK
jgi:tetratricopeptide (TPR) repeat protein